MQPNVLCLDISVVALYFYKYLLLMGISNRKNNLLVNQSVKVCLLLIQSYPFSVHSSLSEWMKLEIVYMGVRDFQTNHPLSPPQLIAPNTLLQHDRIYIE